MNREDLMQGVGSLNREARGRFIDIGTPMCVKIVP